VIHGSCTGAYGFRIGGLAYIPDLKALPAEGKKLLGGLDVLVLDALRSERPHATHMILPESIDLARELGARKTYFTHLCHDIHYKDHGAQLDENMEFAYDGLRFSVGGSFTCPSGRDF
jgi:phosphoribosyl 1,2-cyclic phosphate phosphodiesterase